MKFEVPVEKIELANVETTKLIDLTWQPCASVSGIQIDEKVDFSDGVKSYGYFPLWKVLGFDERYVMPESVATYLDIENNREFIIIYGGSVYRVSSKFDMFFL